MWKMDKIARWFVFFVALLALLGLAACKGGGPGPTPVTCQDPKATNYGQPGACVYPPVVDSIRITNINTPVGVGEGGTIKCWSTVQVTVEYTAKPYSSIPDGPMAVMAFISDDGVRTLTGGGPGVSKLSDTVTIPVKLNCSSSLTTNYIIVRLEQITSPSRETVHASETRGFVLHWQP